ncbi:MULTISPECIES: hypothetical protein [Rhizobium]|uniref:Uncharacterized protein n=1 Tax=Rhizobium favelukesii TaxID=348824 RepID=W6RQN2_9HYPH|nr:MULTISPECIES: hypothetical protein [Rhizobium]MCS0462561.1 hypothetical protein [Rhizobium favelukesii]UFS79445.1 hypothetical protein LPB79_07665 [Rhizobium sp. T136]CDM63019.1 hypothetical protein LPU83_pLPU83d_1649 [Rhizobium favelukesii]
MGIQRKVEITLAAHGQYLDVRGQRGANRRNAVIAISAALFGASQTPN